MFNYLLVLLNGFLHLLSQMAQHKLLNEVSFFQFILSASCLPLLTYDVLLHQRD